MRRIALVLLVLLVIIISVILVEHYTNSKNHYLEISSTEVQNFVNTKYNSDRFNVISNHTTPDNLYFYVLLFDKNEKKYVFTLITRNSNGYIVSHENIYENNDYPLDVFQMGGDLDMSVILINDKMIENIEILNHSGSNQVFTKFRNNSVYYSSEISLVNGYDSNDNVVTYKCLDDSFCVP